MAPSEGDEEKLFGTGNEDLKTIHAVELAEFRKRMEPILKKYPRYDTDFALLRWLKGYKYDIEMAAQKMEWSLNTLDAIGTFDKDLSTEEKIQESIKAVTPAAEYFPGGNLGFDKNGYVIHVHDVGKVNPRSLVGSGRVSEFYIAAIYDCEGTQCLVRSEEAKRGRKLGAIVIIDLSEFSFDVIFHIPATKIYMTALTLVQDLFPDTAIRLYVVNAPLAVNVLLHMVKMVLAKETLETLEILGSDWKEILVQRHGAECLPKSCGGLKSNDILRKGGVVPDSVKAQIKKMYIPPEKLTKITVGAREAMSIRVNIQKPNSTLIWYFTCSSGDIDFSVVLEGHEVWPRFRISTEFSPEFNELICKKMGIYELLFSNKHGRLWNKHIHYSIDVIEPQT